VLRLLTLLLAVLIAGGCGGNDEPEAARLPAPAAEVDVTRDDETLPAPCGPKPTAVRVMQFLRAIELGDRDALDTLLVESARFQWFSSSESGADDSHQFTAHGASSAVDGPAGNRPDERPRALTYLSGRAQHGERIRLIELEVSRVPAGSWFPAIDELVVGIEYEVTRRARDLDALGGENRVATGKGGLTCRDLAIVAWSMGLRTDEPVPTNAARLCPAPKRRSRSRERAVACTAPGTSKGPAAPGRH
jgi:hypothetical protein